MKKEDVYYNAMLARDSRFDGKFFIGVKTTQIYCRPICPAKPKKENVEFFPTYLSAERAGYRPCMRCRPESAPDSPAWIGKSAIVRRAIKVLRESESNDLNENQFAEKFGVSARHLRRVFVEEIGKTPKQIYSENRLGLARKLLVETGLPITEIVYASGFKSIRRFNDAFKLRFKKEPRYVRRNKIQSKQILQINLPYRPPFDFEGLYKTYENHRIGHLEYFEDRKMHRIVSLGKSVGKIIISNNPETSQLRLEIDFSDSSQLHNIIRRVRSLFDLDSDPALIANTLEIDPEIKSILDLYPGIRLASGWDPFEIAIGTILGQLVSVEQARSLVLQLIEGLGMESGLERNGVPIKLFPTPEQIVASDLSCVKTTRLRKKTIIDFAQAILDKKIRLDSTQSVEEFIKDVRTIKGIGPWTANYMALKVLRHTDAFPGSDLILARAMELHSKENIEKMQPWRGYLAMLFWRHYYKKLEKK